MSDGQLTLEESRVKYRVERDKRLRPEGRAQYSDLSGEYETFDNDPYADPNFTRDARTEEVEAVIIGAGFGGMMAAANLRKQGIDSFRIIEKAGDFGGTWYWNRYPGCMCDVESYIYLPLLEDTGYMPSMRYAPAYEIFEYCQLIGRTFNLYENALFQTEVDTMDWSDDTSKWTTVTSRGDRITSKFIVIAGGVLNKAKLPGINGITNFKGKMFHTSRWDYSYTGGTPKGGMDKLADKRVAVIGTGATAVQVVPRVAEAAKEVYVFQRTPAFVGIRNQSKTDPAAFEEMASKPGWQDERIRNFTASVSGLKPPTNMVNDEWTKVMWTDTTAQAPTPEEQEALEQHDLDIMNAVRKRIADTVNDPETAEKLMPYYGVRCKRPCFHDEYLPTFNRDNVHLVDTNGQGVDEITENGIVVDGVEYPVDLIVFASGFEVTSDYHHRLGFDPRGRNGISMSESWGEGAHTLHGVFTHDFPNLLMISTVQGGFGVNFVHYISETSKHVAWVIAECDRLGITEIEADPEAEEAWLMTLLMRMGGIGAYNATCTPGYLNSEQEEGTMKAGRNAAFWGSVEQYAENLVNWREDADKPGVLIKRS